MYLVYCPKCGEVTDIRPEQTIRCWCAVSEADWSSVDKIVIRGDAVIVHICPDRFEQALQELETGPSAGISGMVLREDNGMIEIEREEGVNL